MTREGCPRVLESVRRYPSGPEEPELSEDDHGPLHQEGRDMRRRFAEMDRLRREHCGQPAREVRDRGRLACAVAAHDRDEQPSALRLLLGGTAHEPSSPPVDATPDPEHRVDASGTPSMRVERRLEPSGGARAEPHRGTRSNSAEASVEQLSWDVWQGGLEEPCHPFAARPLAQPRQLAALGRREPALEHHHRVQRAMLRDHPQDEQDEFVLGAGHAQQRRGRRRGTRVRCRAGSSSSCDPR